MIENATEPLSQAVFVTGNPGKLEEAQRLCGLDLEAVEVDLPEIQTLEIQQVLQAKAVAACRILDRPVIVDETGLELAALNGFPGVLVKWMLQSVGAEGLARTAHRLGDERATARCALLYYTRNRSVFAEGVTSGRLVLPARGAQGFGWDPVFQPDGHALTYAELRGPEKDLISHRGIAWRNLKERLA